jgi:hypothetical protein
VWSDVAYPRLDGSNIPGRDEGALKPGAEAAPLGGFSALGVPPKPGLEQTVPHWEGVVYLSPVAANGKRSASQCPWTMRLTTRLNWTTLKRRRNRNTSLHGAHSHPGIRR